MSTAHGILFELTRRGCAVEPCGSRVTCNPPPTETDEDYLVVVPLVQQGPAVLPEIVVLLEREGFKWEGGEHYQIAASEGLMSWRKGDTNLLVTISPEFAKRHRAATFVCKRLNLQNKYDRIALFQAVLYAKQWEPEEL